MRVTFREVSARRTVKVPCIACGKHLSRVIREFQTINPWNLDAYGAPKSEHEIRAELPAQLDRAEERLRKRAICRACEGQGHRINFSGEHVRPVAIKKAVA